MGPEFRKHAHRENGFLGKVFITGMQGELDATKREMQAAEEALEVTLFPPRHCCDEAYAEEEHS